MSRKNDIREFLISRRGNLTPQDAGIPIIGGDRRVPGLRREEVAELAGVSTDYYTRLERGGLLGASDSILNALARALHLDDIERQHLFDLAREESVIASSLANEVGAAPVRGSVQRVLDNMTVPAVVIDATQALIASNLAGRALFSPHFEADRPNLARFIFLDSRARDFYEDWALACSLTAAMLRFEAGKDPLNGELTALIGELATRSPQFRKDWAERDVHEHRTGRKIYRHPGIGDLDLTYDVFEMPGENGLAITTYTADAGSATADKLTLLTSWAATQQPS
ncbi:helix-turn-helix transcriptional regulator [Conyzicola sp.]|uniref:helix-turn-helix transcriptional regulator n=1 Tax=Conyzicola sp. TaxID=1969404 RepID=UPI0039893C8F